MSTDNQINELFELLDKWRKLPNYQLERRADIFFALYLKEILKKKYNKEIGIIIPEFPVRTNSLINAKYKEKQDNRSQKIDYLAVSKDKENVYLIELKTDDSSRNDDQDQFLQNTKETNIPKIIDGLFMIKMASKAKKKYDKLFEMLDKIGWIDQSYKINTSHVYENIEIVYIQPNNKKVEDNVITFQDIIDCLLYKKDQLTLRFLESLENWKEKTK